MKNAKHYSNSCKEFTKFCSKGCDLFMHLCTVCGRTFCRERIRERDERKLYMNGLSNNQPQKECFLC